MTAQPIQVVITGRTGLFRLWLRACRVLAHVIGPDRAYRLALLGQGLVRVHARPVSASRAARRRQRFGRR